MGVNSTLALVPLDYVEFFVFLAILCLVGFFSGRGERKSSTDYFLAGRRLPWYAVGGSYVAANVSTEHFIGLVGATYIMGMPTALAQWVTTLAEVGIGMLLQRIVNVGCSAGGCAYFVIFWAGLGLVVCALLGAILAGVLSRENIRASLPRHH